MMFRFRSHRYPFPLRVISLTFQSTSSLPNPNSYSFPFSPKFCTTTSHSHSFRVSYLINTLGFMPEFAFKASKQLRFENSEKPDTVVAFFRSHGFSDSQGLVRGFFESDKKTLVTLLSWSSTLGLKTLVKQNLKLLRDEGVRDSNIAHLIQRRASVFNARGLRKAVDEVKELGFDPSKLNFVIALLAKESVLKPKWNAKVEAFKSWGWSEEAIAAAFWRHPDCMLKSKDKINPRNSLDLVIYPRFLGYSLEKRIIPRAFVLQYLLAKG